MVEPFDLTALFRAGMAFMTALNLVLALVMFSRHCGIPDHAASSLNTPATNSKQCIEQDGTGTFHAGVHRCVHTCMLDMTYKMCNYSCVFKLQPISSSSSLIVLPKYVQRVQLCNSSNSLWCISEPLRRIAADCARSGEVGHTCMLDTSACSQQIYLCLSLSERP